MTSSGGVVLEPGVQIRPQVEIEDVIDLVQRLYHLDNITVVELNAYDDKNYHLKVNDAANRAELWTHGYVLKIMNTLESQKPTFIDAQTQMMIYLGMKGIQCPKPVKNVDGQYYCLQKFYQKGESSGPYKEHIVRLLTFQPGTILYEVPCPTNELFHQAGQYIGNVDNLLKGFHHPIYATHKTQWMLASVPMLRKFQYAVRDKEHYKMVTEILDAFDREVVPQIPHLDQGMLHGDYNEQNILVQPTSDKQRWEISGLLDFGDTQYSCYLFELAITVCYMMLLAKDEERLDVAGHVIAGYSTFKTLTVQEFQLLKVCVCARLCQSLVLGAYSHIQDPGNVYILTTQAAGWKLLTCLKDTPQHLLEQRWKKIIESYTSK